MKHNKKRNTAFIYEILSKELTKAIVDENFETKAKIMNIIKEHFSPKSLLAEELRLYRTLLDTRNTKVEIAEKILQETKTAHRRLDGATIFDEQSRIIASINKQLGQHIWNTFLPNFKSLASVDAIFNNKTSIKSKVLFEQAIVDAMSDVTPLSESNKLHSIDNLAYKTFINKFNDKYADLLIEQKELLNRYITSFADDGFELRLYLNEELGRLKGILSKSKNKETEQLVQKKIDGVLEYLEEFRKRKFDDTDLNKVLKTQELAQELRIHD